jgi:hypothetical protein
VSDYCRPWQVPRPFLIGSLLLRAILGTCLWRSKGLNETKRVAVAEQGSNAAESHTGPSGAIVTCLGQPKASSMAAAASALPSGSRWP